MLKKMTSLNRTIFLFLLGIASFSSYADPTNIHKLSGQSNDDCACHDKIIALEERILALKERVDALENKNIPNSSSADTWICKYIGFNSSHEYIATGPTRAIADLRASEKCKTSDTSNGYFCKQDKCYQ